MADPRERYADPQEITRASLDGRQAGLWTAIPGIIQSYNSGKQTVEVQPAIKANITASDGTVQAQAMPLLVDVPVQFPAGSGHSMTFPVASGDECLVVFSSRCIDGWWANGGVQAQAEGRMHDLSDGMALLGFRSQPRALSSVSTTSVQLRSDDGETYVDVNGPAKTLTLHSMATSFLIDGGAGTVGITAPNGVVVDGPTLACTGEVIKGFNGVEVHLGTHVHPTAVPGLPSPPTPGS